MNTTQTQTQHTAGYLDMELLRFTTAGSVDDGKSTLIGRLLYDSKAIFDDQLESIERASARLGGEEVNLALLTDGLRAEREQGITIDVAYRYFATPKRKFIIADTPGHVQYTRNMVTGASTANVALILVDARQGVLEQTRRHSFIASLLQIKHIVLCVNKMDLVDFNQEIFETIKKEYAQNVATKLDVKDIRFVPVSAKLGDNVVDRSENMPWYQGQTLLELLETIEIVHDRNLEESRFPVQYVIRPQSDKHHDYRGYAGRVAGGVFRPGDEVTVLPSGIATKIKSIELAGKSLDVAFPPLSVAISLEDDVDISRGNMIVKTQNLPQVSQDITARVCWLSTKPLALGQRYFLKHTTHDVRCMVTAVNYMLNISTLELDYDKKQVGLNDIAEIQIKTTEPLLFDSYSHNRISGSCIIIEEGTNNTVGACMIV
jgi:sulfate adenylyltransferase subunit 1